MIAAVLMMLASLIAPGAVRLEVPIIEQSPERCGQAALGMVLQYYGADHAQMDEAESAYDPVLHGSLITDLASAARRAGFEATIAKMTTDSLVVLLGQGVPAIVLYQSGGSLLTTPHFGVVTGWDPAREAFTLNDGGVRPRTARRGDLAKHWRTAGSLALVIRRPSP